MSFPEIDPDMWASLPLGWRGAGGTVGRPPIVARKFSYTGPEGALPHGLEQFRERDAQRPRQPKQILEGRVPASGFNLAQVRPLNARQFRQALRRQPSLAVPLPGYRWAVATPTREASSSSGDNTLDVGIIAVLRWSARSS